MNTTMDQEGREEDEAFFNLWMKGVSDAIRDRMLGSVTAVDFPRFNYREAFDHGKDADEVAGEILDHSTHYS